MARSASRMRSLLRACEFAHDRAFNPHKYKQLPPPPPQPAQSTPAMSRKEWLEEHFRLAVQKEFAQLAKK